MSILNRLRAVFTADSGSDRFDPYVAPYYCRKERLARKQLFSPSKSKLFDYTVVGSAQGGMGKIFIVRDNLHSEEQRLWALKIILPQYFYSLQAIATFQSEIMIMVGHKQWPALWVEDATFQSDNTIVLKLPYCIGGSLYDRITDSQIHEKESIYHLLSIVYELNCIHKNGITHRDLKPENVLLYYDTRSNNRKTWQTLISDFGIATIIEQKTSIHDYAGTLSYAAPEQLIGENLTEKVDVWAWGVMAWLLLTGRHPYDEYLQDLPDFLPHLSLYEKLKKLPSKIEPQRSAGIPSWLKRTILGCIAFESQQRPTTSEILGVFQKNITLQYPNYYTIGCDPNQSWVTYLDHTLGPYLVKRNNWELVGNTNIILYEREWPDRIAEINKLVELRDACVWQRVITLVDDVLGDWDEEDSLLFQFRKNPNATTYDIPKEKLPPRPFYSQIPLKFMVYLLDIKCSGLANIASEFPASFILKELYRTASLWAKTGQFGDKSCAGIVYPHSCLTKIAQGFILNNDFEKGEKYLDLASMMQTDMALWVTQKFLYQATGNYKAVYKLAIKIACDAQQNDSMIQYQQWLSEAIMSLLDINDLEGAYDLFLKHKNTDMPLIDIMRYIVKSRMKNKKEFKSKIDSDALSSDNNRLLTYLYNIGKYKYNPRQFCYAAECAYNLQEKEIAKEIAQTALLTPRSLLPMYRYHIPVLYSILKGKPNFTISLSLENEEQSTCRI